MNLKPLLLCNICDKPFSDKGLCIRNYVGLTMTDYGQELPKRKVNTCLIGGSFTAQVI